MSTNKSPSANEIHLEAIRAKYREERLRRMREDRGVFVAPSGDFSRFGEDPYTERVERDPVRDEMDVVIVGGGWAGLLVGAKLRKAAFDRIRIIEKAGDVGGVWYWNRYPGAMCDVQSYIYLPLLEEVGYMPERRYSYAEEIQGYAQKFSRHFNLYENVLFQTEVTSLTWDEDSGMWTVETDRADRVTAPHVVICNGSFTNLKLPAIPGVEKFTGEAFHTSRWNYAYTGGAAHEFLDKLGDKKVGVIGTGATAVQVIPPLGEAAENLYVFQRTPSTVAVRGNVPTDYDKMAALEPGWQQVRRDNFTKLVNGLQEDLDYIDDGWTQLYRHLQSDPAFDDVPAEEMAKARELADFGQMDSIRARISEIVQDPATAEALKPYYRYLCKRPCFHDEYLDTFNRDNVTLVDTKGRGVDRITDQGVIVDGKEYKVDCLVFATGFDQESAYTVRTGFDVIGRAGMRLSEKWESGVSTFHGLTTRGFPNLIIIPTNNMQSVMSVNVVHCIENNAEHAAYILLEAARRSIRTFDTSAEAENDWVQRIREGALTNQPFLQECTPSRNNNEGRLDDRSLSNANFAGPPHVFFNLLEDWRHAGELEGLELTVHEMARQ